MNIDETEQVIEEALEVIAKYTVDDYLDENRYNGTDSDDTTSSASYDEDADETGMAMSRIVSIIPPEEQEEIHPNPSLTDGESTDDENSIKEDLRVARETLYAIPYGMDAATSCVNLELETIKEATVEKEEITSIDNDNINKNANERNEEKEESPKLRCVLLSAGESSDFKISSDANSDLP